MDLKTRILLVDDRPENLMVLEAALEDLGQMLVRASSAKEALKHLMEAPDTFAVILLDVDMPEMDGFEAAALIRQREKTRSIPIIFLTAYSRNQVHIEQAYSTGAVDYLFKPLDPIILKAKVSVFVELARQTRALQAEIEQREAAERAVKQLNAELERRVKERTRHIQTLNRRLKQMIHETHDRVRNNLQILIAMIDLQTLEGDPDTPVKALQRLGTHVRTLSLVHDLLTEQTEQDATSYLLPVPNLLPKVLALVQQTANKRRLSVHVQQAHLPVRESTSLALITAELGSNAIQHGRGEVEVTFTLETPHAELQVCDAGPGFAPDFNPRHPAHLGLHFVEDLTRHDLKGYVRYENRDEGGARVVVSLPYHSTL